MHKYELAIIKSLQDGKSKTPEQLMEEVNLGKDELLWAIENLSNISLIDLQREKELAISFFPEGEVYANSLLPEDSLLEKLKSQKKLELKTLISEKDRIALQWCIKKKLAQIKDGYLIITPSGEKNKVPSNESILLNSLSKLKVVPKHISAEERSSIDEFKSRKLLEIKEKNNILSIKISKKGLEFKDFSDSEHIDELTKEIITSKNIESLKFKKYDISVGVPSEIVSMRHPLRSLINDIKITFSQMGFNEISGPIIEPSFWVFDSLFVPQDHPARDTQDTFHLSNPEFLDIEEQEYLKQIKKTNTKAWKIKWNDNDAKSAVLRTQMTSVSVRYIREFIKQFAKDKNQLLPKKLFTVGRVFRNENLDYKHLTDFYQTDGIIIGKNLTLSNLFDTLITFYKAFNVNIRFKPAYFPFVEPGAEIFAQLGEKGEWLEIGGSGIIRREITGIKRKDISVLAWGLGIERMLLLKDKNMKSITEYYNSDLGWLRSRELI